MPHDIAQHKYDIISYSSRGVLSPDEEVEKEASPEDDRGVEGGREEGGLLPVRPLQSPVEPGRVVACSHTAREGGREGGRKGEREAGREGREREREKKQKNTGCTLPVYIGNGDVHSNNLTCIIKINTPFLPPSLTQEFL